MSKYSIKLFAKIDSGSAEVAFGLERPDLKLCESILKEIRSEVSFSEYGRILFPSSGVKILKLEARIYEERRILKRKPITDSDKK